MDNEKKKERIYLFDNIKFFLIILVVIGHFIDPVIEKSQFFKNIFTYTYLFHMPLFIFIFGYFSKSFFQNGKAKAYKVFQFIILYLLLRAGEYLVYLIFDWPFHFTGTLTVGNAPWYLLAMSIWMSTIPIIHSLKAKPLMIISVIAGILVGMDSTIVDFLTSSRVIVFYPFFLAGYYLTKENLNKLLNRDNSLIALLILLILGLIIFNNDFNTYTFRPLLTGRNPYDVHGWGNAWGMLYRFVYYIVVFLVIGSIINLFPRKKHFFSKWGERTLQVYFLHYFIYTFFRETTFYPWLIENIPYWKIALLLLSIIITIILSLKIFSYPFNWIGKLQFKSLTKKTTQ